jgi:hypothetical protein
MPVPGHNVLLLRWDLELQPSMPAKSAEPGRRVHVVGQHAVQLWLDNLRLSAGAVLLHLTAERDPKTIAPNARRRNAAGSGAYPAANDDGPVGMLVLNELYVVRTW